MAKERTSIHVHSRNEQVVRVCRWRAIELEYDHPQTHEVILRLPLLQIAAVHGNVKQAAFDRLGLGPDRSGDTTLLRVIERTFKGRDGKVPEEDGAVVESPEGDFAGLVTS